MPSNGNGLLRGTDREMKIEGRGLIDVQRELRLGNGFKSRLDDLHGVGPRQHVHIPVSTTRIAGSGPRDTGGCISQ